MGELLLDEAGCTGNGGKWSVERRFRVTEVFLAVLWVCISLYLLQGVFTFCGSCQSFRRRRARAGKDSES
jgi:hypothetical protein